MAAIPSDSDALTAARNFLREFLTEEKLYDDILDEASKRGIRAPALWDVRDGLVRARKDADDNWYWRLAVPAAPVEPAPAAPVDETGFASLSSRLGNAPDYDPNSLEHRVKALELKVQNMALDIESLRFRL